jgi:leucine dehydrogenase
MVHVRRETDHVVGLPQALGGSGDPSPKTALGVYRAMQALTEEAFGTTNLAELRINVQGLGHVGMALVELLSKAKAQVAATDIRPTIVQEAQRLYNITPVAPDDIYGLPCDIFAPCALGEIINDQTIDRLNCRIVAGAANNPLASERHGELLHRRGVLYGVDYVINAGGLIAVAQELEGYDEDKVNKRTLRIFDTVKEILKISREQQISPQQAASALAQERLQSKKLPMTS